MTDTSGDRLLALEELTAHQAKTIEELSSELAAQGVMLGRAEKALEVLAKRLVALEEGAASEVPVTRPPHW